MRTKLSVFCDNLIEAGGLAAVVVLPLTINIYSARVFEMTKGCLVRSIALVILAAWVIGAVERWRSRPDREPDGGPLHALRQPLVLPALLILLVYLIASAASVWPRASFSGSYRRMQGAYTTAAYVVIFFTLWSAMRRREQVERLVRFSVLTGVAVAGYAVMQNLGLDPIIWGRDVSERVTSTLGNPIFVAAYLIMVIPLTARQVARAVESVIASSSSPSLPDLILAGLYGLALVLQLVAVVFTQSRGPFLGLVGGAFFFLLLLVAHRRRRDLALVAVGLAVAVAAFLVVLNLPDSPLASLKELPYVGRLGTIARSAGLESRILIWQGAAEMVADDPLRTVIGHGPEVMMEAYQPYVEPELVSMSGPALAHDRSHNAVWQALVDRGILGAATDLLFIGSLFYYGLRWLGLLSGAGDRGLFLGLSIGGALAGLVVPWVGFGRIALIGLGVPLGLLAGIAAFLVIGLFLGSERPRGEADRSLLIIALLSGVAAHVIETQTGIAVTVTRSYLWIYAALTIVVGRRLTGERATDRPAAAPRSPRLRRGERTRVFSRSLVTCSLSAGLLLVTLVFSLATHRFALPQDAPTALFLGALWLAAGLLITLEDAQRVGSAARAGWSIRFGAYVGLSLAFSAVPVALHLVGLPPSPSPGQLSVLHYASLGGGLLVIALSLLRERTLPRRFWHLSTSWLYAVVAAGAGVAIVLTNLNVVRANVAFETAQALVAAQDLDSAVTFYQRARRLAPGEPRYALLLSHTYLRLAQAEEEHPEIWLRESEEALTEARRLNPLDPEIDASLGQVYWYRAVLLDDDPQEKAAWLETALRHYQRAVEQSPIVQGDLLRETIMAVRVELAEVYEDLGRMDEAIEQARSAANLASADRRAEIERFIGELQGGEAEVEVGCSLSDSAMEEALALWRCEENEACYDPSFDKDGDGRITVVDVTRLVAEWRRTCPQE